MLFWAVFYLCYILCFNSVQGVLKEIYCTLADTCECDFKPNIRDLEWDLYTNLYGQHLAQDLVSEEVKTFLATRSPDRPLVLSLHGGSGTGKSLVSSMLASHLYGSGMGSSYVHQFIPTLHFPAPERANEYRVELKAWVEGNLTACARSVFIFEEMERMPAGVLGVLEPFLGPSHVVFKTNYRKAIYLFISTTGEEVINAMALEYGREGRDREEIRASDLQDAIIEALSKTNSSGFSGSRIIEDRLVTRFVPFLPLCRRHVERCARHQLCQQGMCGRSDVVEAVGGDMQYTPSQGKHFSTTGCKAVPAKINLFL